MISCVRLLPGGSILYYQSRLVGPGSRWGFFWLSFQFTGIASVTDHVRFCPSVAGWECAMPICRLLQSEGFDAEQCQAMGIAFEGILQELQLQDRDDPLCTLIAQTLI